MKTLVVKADKTMLHGIELTHSECVKLSNTAEIAAILDLSESPRGYQVIYQDGVTRLYDPVDNMIIGAHAARAGRNGWIS